MADDLFSRITRAAGPPLRDGVRRVLRPARRVAWIDRSLAGTVDYLIECRVVRLHLSDAYDRNLPGWRDALVRAHVASCAVCGPVDMSMRSTIDLLRGLRDDEP
jgi:hypothetical protein